jgi:hypothetical protein
MTPDLVDIAIGRSATQSSLSEWSVDGEASRVVAAGAASEFAFHTGEEEAPWWQLDLGAVCPIELIVIHNRLRILQDRARTLKVEVATAPDEWTLVHAGLAHFGAAGFGRPLELCLGSQVSARYVRLSLAERQYLHLSRVEVFARPELLAFAAFCTRHSLTAFYAKPAGMHARYKLARNPLATGSDVIGLQVAYSGRFGNLLHQYLNVIQLAQRTGLTFIQLGHHELLNVTHAFTHGGITFLPPETPLPVGGSFISGEFFNSDDFTPVLSPFLRFRAEDERELTAITLNFIRPLMLTGIPLPDEQHPADELTIHIRSGDIFDCDHPVTYGYRQPPLSYYQLVIGRMIEAGRISRVRLVFEDRGNPCVDELERWLEAHEIPYRINCGSLASDMSALIDAPHLVFGHGTFGYAACRLSTRIETVHYFAPELGGCYGFIPSIGEVFAVHARPNSYIKAFEYGQPFGPDDGWRRTPEMRLKMLAYPMEWLRLEQVTGGAQLSAA